MYKQLIEILINYWDQLVTVLPNIVLAIVVFIITLFVARRVKNVVAKRAEARLEDPLLAKFLSRITKWVLLLIGLAFSLHIIGLSKIAGSILAGAGVSAFILGFALKDIGENFLAGIMIAFSRPFQVGDTVETGSIKGRIKTINIRNTQVQTIDGKDIFVPNAMIIKTPLVKYPTGEKSG